MEKLIDLHTHTTFSDGDLTPQELIKLAKDSNISTLAITDHDSTLGIKQLIESNYNLEGIDLIPGIEFSAKVSKGAMHILGLGIDIYNDNLNKRLEQIRTDCMNHFFSVLEQIKIDYGISFSYEEIRDLMNVEHVLSRPDIARLCIKNGYANSVNEAFKKYLVDANDKVRGRNKGITYEECIELILNSGGIPVLAHPQQLGLNNKDFLILLTDMIKVGLQGMEIYHSDMTQDEMKMYADIANQYNLLTSGGSDYHGPIVKPNIKLGTGINDNIKVKKLSILDTLKKY